MQNVAIAVKLELVPEKLGAMLSVLDVARIALERTLRDPETTIDRNLVDSVSKLASAHAALSRECAKWNAKARKEAAQASLEDRKRGVISFICGLPVGERKALLAELVAFEQSTPGGLTLLLS